MTLSLMKFAASALIALPLLMTGSGLSNDGGKYLDEAKKRIAKVEKEIDADVADAARANAAKEDLLSSKRFLDNVQKEQPKNTDAVKLQEKADALLAKLKPTLLKTDMARSLDELDAVLSSIDKDLGATRDAKAEAALMDRFDGVRAKLKDVLAADPANARAIADKEREDSLWKKFEAQRQAKSEKKAGGAK